MSLRVLQYVPGADYFPDLIGEIQVNATAEDIRFEIKRGSGMRLRPCRRSQQMKYGIEGCFVGGLDPLNLAKYDRK